MERLNPAEVWLLARVMSGYKLPKRYEQMSSDVYTFAQYLDGLPWKSREFELKTRFEADEIERIHAEDSMRESPPIAETPTGRAWQIIPAQELAHLPKASWLLQDIIPEFGLSVLYGGPGAFKSFTALDWALQVSQHRSVIYTIYEGLNGYWQRIRAWCIHNRRAHGHLYVCIGNLAIMDTTDLTAFIEEARKLSPAMVIVDTLARAMTGSDENNTRDMGMFVSACSQVQRDLNCAVLVIHHTSKGGVQERGSIALRGAADVMIRQHVDDEVIVRECVKMKDAEPFKPTYHRALPVVVTIDGEESSVPVLIESERMVDDGSRLTSNQIKVLETLMMEIFKDGATAQEIQETVPELERGSINRILSRLMKYGLVSQTAKRSPYTITADGMTRMTRMTRLSGQLPNIGVKTSSEQASQTSQTSQTPQRPRQPALIRDNYLHTNYDDGA